MRKELTGTIGVGLLLSGLLTGGCGGVMDSDEESFGQVESAYVDGTEPSPLEWICDLPISTHWDIYAPNQEEEYLNECKVHTDYDASVECYSQTGRPCCLENTHTHSVSYSNLTWHCGAFFKGWRHVVH